MLAGVGVGLVAFYLAFVGSYAHDFRMQVLEEAPWVLYLLPPVVLILINFLRLKFFLGTEGTGIPQTIAALEMDDDDERSKILSLRILLGKMLLTTLGLFSGASMGREGPTVHAGACLVYFTRKIVSFPPYFIQRGLILAGGAAGIAAAFNAPVAGIVFSIEEIGRSYCDARTEKEGRNVDSGRGRGRELCARREIRGRQQQQEEEVGVLLIIDKFNHIFLKKTFLLVQGTLKVI
jgi:H+/Cl- antiporter ClcA